MIRKDNCFERLKFLKLIWNAIFLCFVLVTIFSFFRHGTYKMYSKKEILPVIKPTCNTLEENFLLFQKRQICYLIFNISYHTYRSFYARGFYLEINGKLLSKFESRQKILQFHTSYQEEIEKSPVVLRMEQLS